MMDEIVLWILGTILLACFVAMVAWGDRMGLVLNFICIASALAVVMFFVVYIFQDWR